MLFLSYLKKSILKNYNYKGVGILIYERKVLPYILIYVNIKYGVSYLKMALKISYFSKSYLKRGNLNSYNYIVVVCIIFENGFKDKLLALVNVILSYLRKSNLKRYNNRGYRYVLW